MQRRSVCHHDVVGNVYNVVDRTYSDYPKTILQPFWAFLHITVCQSYGSIARTSFLVFHTYLYRKILVIHLKGIYRGTMQIRSESVLDEPCVQVASHTVVATCVSTVWSDIYFNHEITFDMIVVSSRNTYWCIFGQDNDSAVVISHTYFVFRTYHAVAFHAT